MDAVNDSSVIAQMQNADSRISQASETVKKFAPVAKSILKGAQDIGSTFDPNNHY